MKTLLFLLSFAVTPLLRAEDLCRAEFKPGTEKEFVTITTPQGRVYHDVKVLKVTADTLHFVHREGAASLPFKQMPSEVKTRLGWHERQELLKPSATVVQTDESTATSGDIEEVIRVRAEKEWPQNYSMQKYEIDLQMKSLRRIEELCSKGAEGVPSSKVLEIHSNAEKEWPDHPSMILYEMELQIEAWKKLNRQP